jgi:hypothetical protein
MSYCKHGTYVGDPCGADFICGACEDGLCQHYKKVSGFSWEDTEGCVRCGIPPKPRIYASLEEAQRVARLRDVVTFNSDETAFSVLTTRDKMTEADAQAHIARVRLSNALPENRAAVQQKYATFLA